MAEVVAAFAYNERRKLIWAKFCELTELLKPINEVRVLYIDGSFTTDNEKPKDIDVVVEFTNFNKMIKLLEQHRDLLDHDKVKQDYLTDLYMRSKQMPSFVPDLLGFFQYLRVEETVSRNMPRDAKKGILAVRFKAT